MIRVPSKIVLQSWVKPLFDHNNRYCIIDGGRGSGKSTEVAEHYIVKAYGRPNRLILCAREYQNSIKESVHALIKMRIEFHKLSDYFEITENDIRCPHSNSRFIFKGLRHNINSIKSMAGITDLWIEEGDTLSQESWRVIKPTIREEGSQIVVTMNPKNKTDCIYKEFIAVTPPNNSYVRQVNWSNNPYFPKTLNDERVADLERGDMGLYRHIWEGECLEHSDSQIFKNRWIVKEFKEPANVHKYFGLDFGFSQDPTAGIRCYVFDNRLYMTHEAVKTGLEIDETGKFIEERLPDVRKHTIYADNARPESISFIKRQGYSIRAVEKGKGTVEDGIEYIKSFDKIIVHPRCVETIKELTLYSYKVDDRSGDITNIIIDKYNHCIDALRYALERRMKNRGIDYSSAAWQL